MNDERNPIPKARDLFKGDINAAVIQVQQATGVEITPEWWESQVGNNGTAEEILSRFDQKYPQFVADHQPPQNQQ